MTSRRKRIDEDGNVYRLRRGKWVLIPPEWVGKTTSKQTINARKERSRLQRVHRRRRGGRRPPKHPKQQ